MKKISIFCLILLLITSLVMVAAANSNANLPLTDGCSTLDSQKPILGTESIVDNVGAAILYETATDTLMHSYNADARMDPASLVKILTALIAIEKGSVTDAVTVRSDVLATLSPNAVVVELVADEVLTVKDLLYCMLVGSGNDAAAVLADHVMGSQQAFVAEMNRYAQEIGCMDTVFTNVHGLHDNGQYTTARDAAKILARAIKNTQFCEVFYTKNYSVPETNKSEARRLVSQNHIVTSDNVNYDRRVLGSRTAVADDGTRNLASVAKAGSLNLICIVMGAKSVYEEDGYSVKVYGGYQETIKLLDLGFNGYKAVQILHSGQVLQSRTVAGSDTEVYIGTQAAVYSVIPEDVSASDLQYRYIDEPSLSLPVQKGDRVSAVQVWYEDVCLGQADLYALNTVTANIITAPIASDPIADNNSGKAVIYILGGVASAALIIYIILSVIRAIRIARARKQSRRHSRNRRRSR